MAKVAVDAYESIRERLLSGELPAGTRLVNRRLGKDIGVSHVPVREALHRLVSDGLAEHIPGAGTFVRSLSAQDVSHLYALRECLEGFAVREACTGAADWQIKILHKKLTEGQELLRNARENNHAVLDEAEKANWFRHEQELHKAIIDAAGNPWLSKMVEQIQLLARIIQSNPMEHTADAVEKVLTEHATLVDAIEQNDTERAAHLISEHIRIGFENQMACLKGN